MREQGLNKTSSRPFTGDRFWSRLWNRAANSWLFTIDRKYTELSYLLNGLAELLDSDFKIVRVS